MTSDSPEVRWNSRDKISRWLLMALCLVLGIESGAGLLEAIVIVPLWSASAEAARGWSDGAKYIAEGGRFFGIFSPLLLLLTLATLIGGWRSPQPLRRWLFISAAIVLALMAATFVYYLPGQIAMKGATPVAVSDANLEAKARLWVILNWVRQLAGVVAFGSALHAVGLSYRQEANAVASR